MKRAVVLIILAVLSPGLVLAGWLPKTNWKIHFVDSENTHQWDERAVFAIDGRGDTHWFSRWSPSPADPLPHEIQIDLGKVHAVDGFRYLPRQSTNTNGQVKDYEFYVSLDGQDWGEAITGTFGSGLAEKERLFAPRDGRFVRFVALSEINGHHAYTTAAEIGVREFGIQKVPAGMDVKITFEPSPDERVTGHNIFVNDEKTDLGKEVFHTIKKETLVPGTELVIIATAYGECRFCLPDTDRHPCPWDESLVCCDMKDTHLGYCESVHSDELRLLVVDEAFHETRPATPKGLRTYE